MWVIVVRSESKVGRNERGFIILLVTWISLLSVHEICFILYIEQHLQSLLPYLRIIKEGEGIMNKQPMSKIWIPKAILQSILAILQNSLCPHSQQKTSKSWWFLNWSIYQTTGVFHPFTTQEKGRLSAKWVSTLSCIRCPVFQRRSLCMSESSAWIISQTRPAHHSFPWQQYCQDSHCLSLYRRTFTDL